MQTNPAPALENILSLHASRWIIKKKKKRYDHVTSKFLGVLFDYSHVQ